MTKHDDDVVEEKSFNEDELEDIMNEIENLEREFGDDAPAEKPAAKVKAKPAAKAAVTVEEKVEEEVEEVEEVELEEESVASAPVAKVVPMHNSSLPKGNHPAKMHLSVAGDMEVSLEFGIHGQTISLSVDPKEGLVISMQGGAKFCLPLNHNNKNKKTGT
jgi:hypothetical protein